jgi:hypothetical protein
MRGANLEERSEMKSSIARLAAWGRRADALVLAVTVGSSIVVLMVG